MKLFVIILFSSVINAMSITTIWNTDFSKQLKIECDNNVECNQLIDQSILVDESFCEDCFSTDLNASFIFNGIGESITTGATEVSVSTLLDFIKFNEFVSITYDSPYDLISSGSTMQKRLKYRNLCVDATQDPILFFERNSYNEISMPRYIYCGENIFELEMFDVTVDTLEFSSETPELN